MSVKYYAPEIFHDINSSFASASGMWSYMCLFSNLYLKPYPFGQFQQYLNHFSDGHCLSNGGAITIVGVHAQIGGTMINH